MRRYPARCGCCSVGRRRGWGSPLACRWGAERVDSEERGALAIDAAELGTWSWDLSANEFSGCNRFRTLLGLAGARSGETRSSADRILALVEPAHRAALVSFTT